MTIQEKRKHKIHTQAEMDSIIDAVQSAMANDGLSVNAACKQAGVSRTTYLGWVDKAPDLIDKHARAQLDSADILADQMTEILHQEPRLNPITGCVDNGWVSLIKAQADAVKWQTAIRNPRKYSPRTQVSGDADAPLHVIASIERVIVDPAKD